MSVVGLGTRQKVNINMPITGLMGLMGLQADRNVQRSRYTVNGVQV